MTSQPPSDAELAEIAGLAASATPGPWHVQHLDDDHAMSLRSYVPAAAARAGTRGQQFGTRCRWRQLSYAGSG